MNNTRFGLILLLGVVGCGSSGGSSLPPGVSGTSQYSTLSEADKMAVCAAWREEYPSRVVECADNFTITIGIESVAECLKDSPTNPACTTTVDQAEACLAAMDARTNMQHCSDIAPPTECQFQFTTACRPPA